MNGRQDITATSKQQVVLISVVVKAEDQKAAEDEVTVRMNDWFNDRKCEAWEKDEFTNKTSIKYLNGALLHWNFYEPLVVNGR